MSEYDPTWEPIPSVEEQMSQEIDRLTTHNAMLKSGSDQLANERDALQKDLQELKAAMRYLMCAADVDDFLTTEGNIEEQKRHAETLLKVLEEK